MKYLVSKWRTWIAELERSTERQLRMLSYSYYTLAAASILILFGSPIGLGLSILSWGIALPKSRFLYGCCVGSIYAIAMPVLQLLAGRCLANKKEPIFCYLVAGLSCFSLAPLGAILGVLTIVILRQPMAKEMFKIKGGN